MCPLPPPRSAHTPASKRLHAPETARMLSTAASHRPVALIRPAIASNSLRAFSAPRFPFPFPSSLSRSGTGPLHGLSSFTTFGHLRPIPATFFRHCRRAPRPRPGVQQSQWPRKTDRGGAGTKPAVRQRAPRPGPVTRRRRTNRPGPSARTTRPRAVMASHHRTREPLALRRQETKTC